jgi:hypothetical protein
LVTFPFMALGPVGAAAEGDDILTGDDMGVVDKSAAQVGG